jgi:hypothetical protein
MSCQVPSDARNEIKFIALARHYHSLLSWIRLNSAGFRTVYPDRRVNNIYFDSHDYAAYAANLSGASFRTKVRYRWYGQSQSPDRGTLEIKCKRNLFVWKLLFKADLPPYRPQARWSTIRQLLSSQLPEDGKKWLDENPQPVLINQYDRKYFLSHEGKVRVTIDHQQAVFDQRFKPFPNLNHRGNYPDFFVVEFKFNRNDRDIASRYIQNIPIRVSKNSKYINGLSFLSGN